MEITCDNCKSKKVYKNIQLCNVKYDFNYKTQEYSKEPTEIFDPIDNYHYCEKCYKKWINGEL